MEVTLQIYKPEFYDTVCEWWRSHDWQPIPQESLPAMGLISFVGETPVAVVWIYQTDSDLCWIDWFVSNPNYKEKALRNKAINSLILGAKEAAKAMGFAKSFTSIRVPALIKRMESAGFQICDKNMTNLIGVL